MHRMENTIVGWVHQLGTLEFWKTLLESFGDLGPIAPVILAMVESFFPPLPLIAIVALNVAAHGGLLGFVYSWLGIMLGGQRHVPVLAADRQALFLEICPPVCLPSEGRALGQPL